MPRRVTKERLPASPKPQAAPRKWLSSETSSRRIKTTTHASGTNLTVAEKSENTKMGASVILSAAKNLVRTGRDPSLRSG